MGLLHVYVLTTVYGDVVSLLLRETELLLVAWFIFVIYGALNLIWWHIDVNSSLVTVICGLWSLFHDSYVLWYLVLCTVILRLVPIHECLYRWNLLIQRRCYWCISIMIMVLFMSSSMIFGLIYCITFIQWNKD